MSFSEITLEKNTFYLALGKFYLRIFSRAILHIYPSLSSIVYDKSKKKKSSFSL